MHHEAQRLNIVIPMAGSGSRFARSDFSLPKPLIPIADKPMYRYAVDCLPLDLADQLIFIIKKNEFSQVLVEDIQATYGCHYHCNILQLEEETQGQAETVLKSAAFLNLDFPTLVHNCDTYIATRIPWQVIMQRTLDGAIVTFTAHETRWSYVLLDSEQVRVTDMQEKKVISSHASTGTYYFKNTSYLLDTINFIIEKDFREGNEYYLSTVYRIMLQDKKNIISIPIPKKDFFCFGTPEDLVNSLNAMYLTYKVMPK